MKWSSAASFRLRSGYPPDACVGAGRTLKPPWPPSKIGRRRPTRTRLRRIHTFGGYKMYRSSRRGAVALPKGVHRVIARGREYFYYQANRGTPRAEARIVLPHDPHSPEFWIELRKAQGIEQTVPPAATFGMVCDLYEAWPMFSKLAPGTQAHYRHSLKTVRAAWGGLP